MISRSHPERNGRGQDPASPISFRVVPADHYRGPWEQAGVPGGAGPETDREGTISGLSICDDRSRGDPRHEEG